LGAYQGVWGTKVPDGVQGQSPGRGSPEADASLSTLQ